MFKGSLSRSITQMILYPFDSIKVLMQSSKKSATLQSYSELISRKIKEDGFLSLYRGLGVRFFRFIFQNLKQKNLHPYDNFSKKTDSFTQFRLQQSHFWYTKLRLSNNFKILDSFSNSLSENFKFCSENER